MCWSSAVLVRGKLSHRNTPLVTEECTGLVTITDATHPLFGRVLNLAGFAYLPGLARHAHVEIFPGHFGYVPVACTNLSAEPRPPSTVLTVSAIAELVAAFQARRIARRAKYANDRQSQRLESAARQRASRRRRGDHAHPHGGGGK